MLKVLLVVVLLDVMAVGLGPRPPRREASSPSRATARSPARSRRPRAAATRSRARSGRRDRVDRVGGRGDRLRQGAVRERDPRGRRRTSSRIFHWISTMGAFLIMTVYGVMAFGAFFGLSDHPNSVALVWSPGCSGSAVAVGAIFGAIYRSPVPLTVVWFWARVWAGARPARDARREGPRAGAARARGPLDGRGGLRAPEPQEMTDPDRPLRLDAPREEALEHVAKLVAEAWRSFDRPRPEEPPLDERLRAILQAGLPHGPGERPRGAGRRGASDGRVDRAAAAAVLRVHRFLRPRDRRARRPAGGHLRHEPRGRREGRHGARAAGRAMGRRVHRLPGDERRVHERRHDLEHDGAGGGAGAGAARLARRRPRRAPCPPSTPRRRCTTRSPARWSCSGSGATGSATSRSTTSTGCGPTCWRRRSTGTSPTA